MTTHRNSFEGQTSGSAATAANSAASGDGWTAQSVAAGGTLQYGATAGTDSSGGSIAVIASAAASTSVFFYDRSFNSASLALSDCFYYAQLPTVQNTVIADVRDDSSSHVQVALTTAGHVSVLGVGGTTLATSASALTPGHSYRFELQATSDATAGTVALQYYIDDGTTVGESLTGTGNTRGGNFTEVRRGCTAPQHAGSIPSWKFNYIQAADGTTTPLGAFPAAPTPGAYVWVGSAWVRSTPYVSDGTTWSASDVVTAV